MAQYCATLILVLTMKPFTLSIKGVGYNFGNMPPINVFIIFTKSLFLILTCEPLDDSA